MPQSERLSEYAAEHRDGIFQLLVGVGCVNALGYNVVHYLMIQRTSAVTTTVLGEIKIVGLLLLSALLLGVSLLQSLLTHSPFLTCQTHTYHHGSSESHPLWTFHHNLPDKKCTASLHVLCDRLQAAVLNRWRCFKKPVTIVERAAG